jgi:hypothetical protein
LYLFDVGFEFFADEREVDERRKHPSDESNHDRGTHEGSETTSYPSDKVRPEHLPRRADVFHKFIETG